MNFQNQNISNDIDKYYKNKYWWKFLWYYQNNYKRFENQKKKNVEQIIVTSQINNFCTTWYLSHTF